MYGGNQGREPNEETSHEPPIADQIMVGLAIMFLLLIAGHLAGFIS